MDDTQKYVSECNEINAQAAEIKRLSDSLNREIVQHAGCLTAADGSTVDVAKPGDYGWSAAYQAVLDLRRKYDTKNDFLNDTVDILEEGASNVNAMLVVLRTIWTIAGKSDGDFVDVDLGEIPVAVIARIAAVTDELEKMKIRCILKLDPDSPIQKLDIGPQPPAGDRSEAK